MLLRRISSASERGDDNGYNAYHNWVKSIFILSFLTLSLIVVSESEGVPTPNLSEGSIEKTNDPGINPEFPSTSATPTPEPTLEPTPSPTPVATPTYSPTPIPSATPIASPTPTPTPTPTPQCPYYFLRITEDSVLEGTRVFNFSAFGTQISCMQNIAAAAIASCKSIGECITNDPFAVRNPAQFYNCDECVVMHFQEEFVKATFYNRTQGFSVFGNSQTAYFDNTCRTLSYKPSDACDAGEVGYLNSPISLLWNAEKDFDSEATFSSFPINPHMDAMWYVWKASADAPLLVYDPAHTGKITSGQQLFGNWTFGGKRLALGNMPINVLTEILTEEKWNDGFEALAMLDGNLDKRISGEELSPLGLWFDSNRDGVSDAGEVRSIMDEGVVALYYTADRRDEITGSIYATLGFERIKDGDVITGSMVDWFGEGAPAQSELVNKLAARNVLCDRGATAPSSQISATASELSEPNKSEISRLRADHRALTGVWKWSSTDSQFQTGEQPSGLLVIKEAKHGVLTGHSIVEIPMEKASYGTKSAVTMFPLNGTIVTDKTGREVVNFNVISKNGQVTESQAVLSLAGEELRGESMMTITTDGKPMKFTYQWSAKRVDIY